MGKVKIDKKKLAELIKSNAELKKELAEMGITLKNLEDINELSDEAQRAVLRANYDKLTEGGIIIVPVECGAGYHWDAQQGKCVENTTQPPEPHPEASKDQYGITKIYKDKPEGGVFITSDQFKEEEFERHYASGKPSENSYENEFKSDTKLDNVEATFYVKINGFKKEPDTLSIKLLGGDHNDQSNDKWQIFEVMTDGSDKKTFEIEDPHPTNHGNHVPPLFNIDQTLVGKWIGVKAITYLIDGGTDASAETWIDFPVDDINNPPNKWRKYIDIASLKNCDHGFVRATGGNILLRIDGTKKGDMPEVKYQSLREILPEGNVPEQPPTNPPPTEPPGPTTPPTTPPPSGNVLWDSNKYWNDGKPRTVTGKDPANATVFTNSGAIEMHASGSPQLEIDGKGVGTLVCKPGHGRFYIDCCNYNAMLEYEVNFLDGSVENQTMNLRSRHQEGEPPENRMGGIQAKLDLKNYDFKTEIYHNEHENASGDKALPKPLELNKWYKVRYTVKDVGTSLYQSMELDYGTGYEKVGEQTINNPNKVYMEKDKILARSYAWLRMNNSKNAKVAFRNVKIIAL